MSKQIIRLSYTEDMVERAYDKAERLGSLRGSRTKGAGNFAGYLAEEAVANYLGVRVSSCDDGDDKYHYDLIWKTKKIDVKNKRRTAYPQLHFDGSIEAFNPNQKCDNYIFTSVTYRNKNYMKGYKNPRDEHKDIIDMHLCGIISKDDYFENAKFYKKGDIDPSNGHTFYKDRFNLLYSHMNEVVLNGGCEICGSPESRLMKVIYACNKCIAIYSLEHTLEVFR